MLQRPVFPYPVLLVSAIQVPGCGGVVDGRGAQEGVNARIGSAGEGREKVPGHVEVG